LSAAAVPDTSRNSGSPADADHRCPNCGSDPMVPVYALDNIPVHSTINLSSRQKALVFPTGRLRLGFCRDCAFLSNTVYDASVQDYSAECEESQHVSPTFNSFAQRLAQRWIDAYSLRNKTILEIGCGKGEFLTLMCELGSNYGIGIDPSYQPSRTTSSAAKRMRFINDLYSEKYAGIEADCIMCRHTLEHIGPTAQFVSMIRRAVGNRKDMLVLFELPDATRVLREAAFWDIYYEHCSYFSPGSLARLFRACGFDLLELTRDYADQYILLAARPANSPTSPAFDLEHDLDPMRALVSEFRHAVPHSIEKWRSLILHAKSKGQKTVIWSALSKAVSFLTTLDVGDAIEFATDINPHRHGRFLPITGQEIVPPQLLRDYRPDHVILMNPIYHEEVRRDLDRLGLAPKIHLVGVK
jgi:SAM-dependent methyltransferase